jgi:hypothetical protein
LRRFRCCELTFGNGTSWNLSSQKSACFMHCPEPQRSRWLRSRNPAVAHAPFTFSVVHRYEKTRPQQIAQLCVHSIIFVTCFQQSVHHAGHQTELRSHQSVTRTTVKFPLPLACRFGDTPRCADVTQGCSPLLHKHAAGAE